jgi:hypothetical protein
MAAGRPTLRLTLVVAAAVWLAGCEILGIRDCTTMAVPALSVAVTDGATGETVLAALVIARDGAYVDSARVRALGPTGPVYPVMLAMERAGRYSVEVHHDAYATWAMHRIRVRSDGCHPVTVELQAQLARQN